ncbi:MAG: GNAT family N-acetyltransferase [Anaerolineales bacterium]
MTAAAFPRLKRAEAGLRPVNPRRDMAPLADLIELCFEGQLDAVGRRMLGEMRSFGRAGWLGWLLSRMILPPVARSKGFVWEEQGRLVGNASVMEVEGHRRRWVLSNVAVHPEYRRRGIARQLTQAALALVRKRRGKVVLLQVVSDHEVVQAMYQSLGFQTLCARTTWRRRPLKLRLRPGGRGSVRLRRPHEWAEQWALARRLHPEGLVWPYPLSTAFFRPRSLGAYLGFETYPHWLWRDGDALIGSLTAYPSIQRRQWRLILMVEPEHQGSIEGILLERGLQAMPAGYSAVLDYAHGVGREVFEGLGFLEERTLTWMGLELEPGVDR